MTSPERFFNGATQSRAFNAANEQLLSTRAFAVLVLVSLLTCTAVILL